MHCYLESSVKPKCKSIQEIENEFNFGLNMILDLSGAKSGLTTTIKSSGKIWLFVRLSSVIIRMS